MILPGACVIVFGKMTRKRKKEEGRQKRCIFGNQGRTIFAAMSILFLVGLTLCFFSESAGNPVMEAAGVSQSMGSKGSPVWRCPVGALYYDYYILYNRNR